MNFYFVWNFPGQSKKPKNSGGVFKKACSPPTTSTPTPTYLFFFWNIPMYPRQMSHSIPRPTIIHLGILNDCKKTYFFSSQPRQQISMLQNITQTLIGTSRCSTASKSHICSIISWLTESYCFHSMESSKWKQIEM